MAEHTPTPWVRDGRTVYALNSQGTNRFSFHVQGGHVYQGRASTAASELESNAAFIVKAVNLHDELVGALEAAFAQVRILGSLDDSVNNEVLRICELAIAKAKDAA